MTIFTVPAGILRANSYIVTEDGKNAVLKANSLEDGATARERNNQIGGHKA